MLYDLRVACIYLFFQDDGNITENIRGHHYFEFDYHIEVVTFLFFFMKKDSSEVHEGIFRLIFWGLL